MSKPLFSIITVCFNSAHEIERTLKSLEKQVNRDYQYIVIDGKSTDTTMAMIDKYKHLVTKLVSEPDKGVYDAMNKGLALAEGELIFFLNAGDELYENTTLQKVAADYQKAGRPEVIYGDIIEQPLKGDAYVRKFPKISYGYLYRDTICHQALFAQACVFEYTGPFNLKYSVCADFDWLLNAYANRRFRIHQIDEVMSIFYLGGMSSKVNGMAERRSIILKHMPLNARVPRDFYAAGFSLTKRIKNKLRRTLWPKTP
ncbi:MAG TPA: glycosyltransferase family 2 protein [Candidatus Saccharimonadia bacterium]